MYKTLRLTTNEQKCILEISDCFKIMLDILKTINSSWKMLVHVMQNNSVFFAEHISK